MSDDPFDDVMGADWARSADFSEIGNSHAGILVDANKKHARKYVMGSPGRGPLLYWGEDGKPTETPNDSPLMETCFIFQTDESDDPDDDGRREIRLNKKALTSALRAAVLAAGAKKPELGGWWRVTRMSNGKPKVKGAPSPWGWEVVYKTPAQFAETGADPAPKVSAKTAGRKDRTAEDDDPFAVPE